MVDKKDFIRKTYISKDKIKIQKWYMHYCDNCGVKRSYLPRSKSSLCQSCAWNFKVDKVAHGQAVSISCKGRKISDEQKKSISKTLTGRKIGFANATQQDVEKRIAKRMGITVKQYLEEKDLRITLRKMKKNMLDRLIRFIRDERKSIRYFPFTREQLLLHFEQRFHNHPTTDEPMTWLNYGRITGMNCWEVDHIIPLRYKENGAYYWDQEGLQDPSSETFKKAWALENLQPMWAKYNWSKGAKHKG